MEQTNKKSKKVKVRGTAHTTLRPQKFGFEPFNEAPSNATETKV